MKKIYLKIYSILALILFISCQEEELPEANFNLHQIENLTATGAHEKVSLNWDAPADKTPIGYKLNWSPAGEEVNLDPTTTSYDIEGLVIGTEYTFSIQSVYGEKQISGKSEIKQKPLDELDYKVFPGDKFIITTWNKPTRSDVTGYQLTWSPGGETPVELGSDVTAYQITGVDNDVEYLVGLKVVYGNNISVSIIEATATPGIVVPFITGSSMSTEDISFSFNPAFLPQSTAVSYEWNFGDETGTFTDEAPIHTYAAPGIYSVSLTVIDNQEFQYNTTTDFAVWGEKWAYDLGFQIKPQSPAIADDGTIYIGSEDNTNFHAINPNGTLKWTYSGLGDNVYSSASIGSNGTIYVGSKDNNLHAINPDGTQKWKFDMGGDAIYATPAIASDGTIYIGSDSDNLFAINPDGTQKWAFNTAGFNIRSTPAIADDGTVYIAADDKNLYALDPANGTMIWSFTVGGIIQSGIAIDIDGTVIVGVDKGGSSGAVYAVNPDGTEKWNKSVTGRISVCSPALANGTVYVGTKEGENLLALNASNGSQIWSFSTPGAIINSSPAIDKNGVIYFGSWDDYVYAVNPDGTLKYKYLTGGDVWSSPAIGSDGTIYVGGYDNKLHALEMFSGGLADDVWPMFGKNTKHTGR